MQEILHFIGVCPDSYQHVSILKALVTGFDELSYAYHYFKHLIR